MADLTYKIKLEDIGYIFSDVSYVEKSTVEFIRETSSNKYSMQIDLYQTFNDIVSVHDFEFIAYTQDAIARAKKYNQSDRVRELKKELKEEKEAALKVYEEFNGNYEDYIMDVAFKILDELDQHNFENDTPVLEEVWL